MKQWLFLVALFLVGLSINLRPDENPSLVDDAGLTSNYDLIPSKNDNKPNESPSLDASSGPSSETQNNQPASVVKHVGGKKKGKQKKKKVQTQITQESGSCDGRIIRAFGLTGVDSRFRIFEATSQERHFCVRNTYTCCSHKAYLKSRSLFVKGLNILKKDLEPAQELMALFRGKNIRELISRLKLNEKCHYPISQSQTSQTPEAFFSDDNIRESIRLIGKQAVQFEIYFRNIRSFYSNLLCAICNPLEVRHFKISRSSLSIDVNMETLQRRIDNLEFEVAFTDVLARFIYPLVRVIKCHFDLETSPDFFLHGISLDKTLVIQKAIKLCLDHFVSENPDCQFLMQFKIHRHSLHNDISEQILQTLNILYYAITRRRINDYYSQVKKSDWNKYQDDIHVFFDSSNRRFRRIQVHRAKFVIKDNGLNVYANLMTSHFYKLKDSVYLTSIINAILLLAWNLF